jgi:hypothetical protein
MEKEGLLLGPHQPCLVITKGFLVPATFSHGLDFDEHELDAKCQHEALTFKTWDIRHKILDVLLLPGCLSGNTHRLITT